MKPQVGDEWEVRRPGKRKIVKRIHLIWSRMSRSGGLNRLYADWERLPKGRYSGIWMKDLIKYGTRLSTRAERKLDQERRFKALDEATRG
jgi:hypothetical protein